LTFFLQVLILQGKLEEKDREIERVKLELQQKTVAEGDNNNTDSNPPSKTVSSGEPIPQNDIEID